MCPTPVLASAVGARAAVVRRVAEIDDRLIALSHEIHADPELSWQEHRAAGLVASVLEDAGFAVERGAYATPTPLAAIMLCPQAWPTPGRASYSAQMTTVRSPSPITASTAVGVA